MKLDKIFNISEKVILVTGGTGQIGSNISKVFLDNGAKVVFLDKDMSKKEEIINDLKNDSKDLSVNAFFFKLDISIEDECIKVIRKIHQQFKKIDVLINAAAIDAKFDHSVKDNFNKEFKNFPINLLIQSLQINQLGLIQITKEVCKYMSDSKQGNIINLGSIYSLVSPNHNLYDFKNDQKSIKPIDYVISKSFIPNFSRYIATFYAKDGIRCNTLIPHGIIQNPRDDFVDNWKIISPIGRLCNIEELYGPFLFLASDASSYMTGATLIIDGGWTAW